MVVSHCFGFSGVVFSGQGQQDVDAVFIVGLSLSLQERERFSGAAGQLVSCELDVLLSLQLLVGLLVTRRASIKILFKKKKLIFCSTWLGEGKADEPMTDGGVGWISLFRFLPSQLHETVGGFERVGHWYVVANRNEVFVSIQASIRCHFQIYIITNQEANRGLCRYSRHDWSYWVVRNKLDNRASERNSRRKWSTLDC